MRRAALEPARHVPHPGDAIDHRPLAGPRPALPRRRRLFHPVTGWFRRFERSVEHLLSRHLYPRLPGLPRFYSALLERHLTLVEGSATLSALPHAFDGTRALLVTDIHVGPFLDPAALGRVFARLQAVRPDIILLGGDFTTARARELLPCLPAFRTLTAPLGVFAVLGNHDHYTREPARVRDLLSGCGITVLDNRALDIERAHSAGGAPARLRLAGIDDLHSGHPDLDAALAGAPEDRPTILLSHNPDIVFAAARRGVALVLSGHTHGGQIRIPGLPVLVRMSRYRLDDGHYVVEGGTQVIVSRGLGVTGLPLRLACPPEAVLITLRGVAR
jgi:predicted MPP superfamily phosphohydrolase